MNLKDEPVGVVLLRASCRVPSAQLRAVLSLYRAVFLRGMTPENGSLSFSLQRCHFFLLGIFPQSCLFGELPSIDQELHPRATCGRKILHHLLSTSMESRQKTQPQQGLCQLLPAAVSILPSKLPSREGCPSSGHRDPAGLSPSCTLVSVPGQPCFGASTAPQM